MSLKNESNTMFGKKMMPEDGPVNVNKFVIYAMIPGLDASVAAKFDKKKFASIYTTIFVMGILALTAIVMYNLSIDPELILEMDKTERTDMIYEKFIPQILTMTFGVVITHFTIYTYLVRKWAKEWNKKFEK